jgi:hypothetical protein
MDKFFNFYILGTDFFQLIILINIYSRAFLEFLNHRSKKRSIMVLLAAIWVYLFANLQNGSHMYIYYI